MKTHYNSKDFLSDELFIYWRLYPSKELDQFWAEFINKNDYLQDQFIDAIETFDKLNDYSVYKKTEEIKQKQVEQNKKRRLKFSYTIASAVAVALLTLVTYIYFIDNEDIYRYSDIATIGEVMQNNNVQLYSGNRIVTMENNSALKIYEKGKTAVIEYSNLNREVQLENINNKLVVPYGQRSSIILSDGSVVYLNSGTTIEFPKVFNKERREISVSGEIFIEVQKNVNQPFIIHTAKSMITVHGTSFNLSSYADEERESVVLVDGSIEIENSGNSLFLKPNEMAEIAEGKISHSEIDVSEYISWKKGYLELNNIPLDVLLLKISRYYNIKFSYKNELDLSSRSCSGKLFLSDNFDDVLEAFANLTYLNYERKSDNIIYINDINNTPMEIKNN